jgi:hypothetical protein
MDLMSQADYARHRGVSRQAISKMVGAGKITLREEGGKKGIDPAEADRALGMNVQRVLADGGDDAQSNGYGGGRETQQPAGLTRARTATEVYKARLAELDYNERLGKLRPLDQTEAAAARCMEVVLRAFTGIVGRAEELTARANKDGVPGMRAGRRDVVRDLRKVAAREFAKLQAGEALDAGGAIDLEEREET